MSMEGSGDGIKNGGFGPWKRPDHSTVVRFSWMGGLKKFGDP